jgi:hypothetical protein
LAHEGNKLLLVAYTNHALDQILEAILESGMPEDKVLRIGGMRYVQSSTQGEAICVSRESSGNFLFAFSISVL